MYFCPPSVSSDRKESSEGELKKARNKDIERKNATSFSDNENENFRIY